MGNGNTHDDASPFRRRQEPSAASTLVLVALAIAVAYGGYRTWSWWDTSERAAAPASAPSAPVARAARPNPSHSRVTVLAPAVQSTPGHEVVKCVASGVTTYAASVTDCPPRAEVTVVAIDPKLNLSDGLRNAPAVIRAQTSVAQVPPMPTTAAVDPNVQKKALCQAYEEEIKAIDARARQPLSGHEQDRLTAKRRNARDEQFRLHC